MKLKTLTLYLILLAGFCNPSFSQDAKNIPPIVKQAIISGDSKSLALHFSQNIELLINNKEDVYSKAQAELILKDFFKKNAPSELIVEIEGKTDGISYAICNLKTLSGKFRMYLSYQTIKGELIINRLNISEYN